MTSLLQELHQSIRNQVLRQLPYDRSDAEAVRSLEGKGETELLILWLNWRQRLVTPAPRSINISRQLLRRDEFLQNEPGISALLADIGSGRDLTRYLSRSISQGYVTRASKRRRQDLDLMLNAWGVHHMHVSPNIGNDGFVERSDKLMFVVFRPSVAYLVDIFTHKDFASRKVIEIIADNWPDQGLVYELRGVSGVTPAVSDGYTLARRRNHSNEAFEFHGKVFLPAAALMSSGHSFNAVRTADFMMQAIQDFAERYASSPRTFAEAAIAAGKALPLTPNFAVCLPPSEFGILETEAGLFWKIGG